MCDGTLRFACGVGTGWLEADGAGAKGPID